MRDNPLLAGRILPTLLRMSAPNAVAMLATALVTIAETGFVGSFGTTALAGYALVFPMVMLQQMMSSGAMGGGVSSAISRALGAGDVPRAEQLAVHALLIGLSAGLAFSLLLLAFGPQLYRALGGRAEVLTQALAYSNAVFLGSVSIWLTNTLASVLRGTGNMKIPSLALFLIAAVQICCSGALGLGLGPFPRLGMAGVGLGQAIAFTLGAGLLLWVLLSGRARIRLSPRTVVLDRGMFRDILKVGALSCVSPLQSVITVLLLTRFVSDFGVEALAGYGIGARLEFLLVPITFAVGVAAVPMVGMAIGSGNVARAKRVAWTAGAVAGLVVGTAGVVVAVHPALWAANFTSSPAVLASAASYLQWAGPCYGFLAAGLALYFASQGSGKILGPVLAQSLRLAVIAIGGTWLTATAASAASLFAVVGLAMLAYGLASAASVHWSQWGKKP
jgi:putative MATE family efflux protein